MNPSGNAEEFLVIFYHVVAPAYMIKGAGAGKAKTCNKCHGRLARTAENYNSNKNCVILLKQYIGLCLILVLFSVTLKSIACLNPLYTIGWVFF